jgi:hypothetical protein
MDWVRIAIASNSPTAPASAWTVAPAAMTSGMNTSTPGSGPSGSDQTWTRSASRGFSARFCSSSRRLPGVGANV